MTTQALTIVLVLLVALPARAQDAPLDDARWAPWLGCWRLIQDDRGSLAAATTNPEDVLVCVLPTSADRGVGMTTYVGDRSVVQQTIVADGVSHAVNEPECSGSQKSEWSLTGQRLFTRAEISCTGQPTRVVSGIALMTEGPTWVDIQAVGTGQDAQVRVRRYQRASSPPEGVVLPVDLQGRAVAATRLAGPPSITLEEVIDASGKIAAPAVEAALLETDSRFDLNSRALRELDAADVPDDVVDVMVALSFAGRFTLDRPLRGLATQGPTITSERSSRLPRRYGPASQGRYSPYYPSSRYYPSYSYDPYYTYNPYYAYNPYVYGSYSPYYFYYSPFGYSNWWGNSYNPYYSSGPRRVIVVPGGSDRPSGSGRGRVVQGRGYTQGRATGVQNGPRTDRAAGAGEERSPNGGVASGTSSRRAVSRDGYSSGGSRSRAGSSSGGGSVSGRGTTPSGSGSGSGGSGARSGRTAQPR